MKKKIIECLDNLTDEQLRILLRTVRRMIARNK